ncbi:MAG: hypothetical protein ACTSQJ_01265 [Promethearchaeota archaeon]
MSSENKNAKELRVVLKSDFFQKLERIKKFHGLKNNAEIIRFLITKEFRKIQNRTS